MNILKFWRAIYHVENDYRRANYGGWRFVVMTPFFGIELAFCTPEIYRRVYSTRIRLSWLPRGWFLPRGELVYARDFDRVWNVVSAI